MAIPQDEYIHIVSSNVGDSTVAERELGGLVFTTTTTLPGAGTSTKWDDYSTLDFTRASDVADMFGSTSREAAFAEDYFGYISPSGTTPRKLTFCRAPENEAPAKIIVKIDEEDANFGSFMFLQSDDYTAAQIAAAIEKCKVLNYKYLFSLAVQKLVNGSDTTGTLVGTETLANITAKDLFNYLKGENDFVEDGNGTFMIVSARSLDPDSTTGKANNPALDAFMPMTLFASTDYYAINGTKNFMFKSFDKVKTAVSTLEDKTAYDKANINYYGLVQNYGRKRQFLQNGVNLDGEDAACFCNEIWLKSYISTQLFSLMLDQEKVAAGADGELLIYNTICACAGQGKVNGTIEPLKRLTDAQKRTIFRLTNDANAWQVIYQSGYWLDVAIRQKVVDNRTEYWAYYTLVYSKGDSVRKVEGKDFLI